MTLRDAVHGDKPVDIYNAKCPTCDYEWTIWVNSGEFVGYSVDCVSCDYDNASAWLAAENRILPTPGQATRLVDDSDRGGDA